MAYENLFLKNQLCFALYAATNAITSSYRSQLMQLGLTYPQYLVLVTLWQTDGIPVKTIANLLHLDSATITPILKRLEQAGFIKRIRSMQDERIVHVHLTETCKEIHEKVAQIQKNVACQTQLSDTQFTELRGMLHALIDNLEERQTYIKDAA